MAKNTQKEIDELNASENSHLSGTKLANMRSAGALALYRKSSALYVENEHSRLRNPQVLLKHKLYLIPPDAYPGFTPIGSNPNEQKTMLEKRWATNHVISCPIPRNLTQHNVQ